MTVITNLIDMPTSVKGHTIKNEDGSYSVFLNARLTQIQIEKTYQHELEHIESGDFDREYVQRIESYAHKIENGGY